MTEAQIKHMVDRFLMWKLPEHFNPDDGISFDPVASKGTPYEFRRSPSGTNLFSAEQATAMVRHMLEGLPQPASHRTPEMKRAAMTDARNVCELADTLREIEKQCIQADDPEHHTLSLVKHMARHALARLPQPASDDYQADAGAPALSEKVNVRSEWLPIESAPKDGTKFIGLWRGLPYAVHWQLYYEQWPHQEGGPTYRGGWSAETWDRHMPCSPTHWILLPELNFSNEAERDGVSLKSDTSSQPASEAGKLSTDEVL